jgi:hypothetical protein
VRATTGRDIVSFLFSSNALGMYRRLEDLPARHADKLEAIRDCRRDGLFYAPLPLAPEGLPLDAAYRAPGFTASPQEERAAVTAALTAQKLPRDAVLLIGATAIERGWCANAQLAGYLDEAAFFT